MTSPAKPAPVEAPSTRGARALLAPLLDRRRWLRLARDLAVLAAVLALVGAWQTRGHLAAGSAPAVVLRTLEGAPVPLESLRGQPVLLAIWAPWCGVCRAESDNLARVRRWAGGRARVIPVAAAFEDAAQVAQAAREQGIEGPVLLADEAAVAALRVEAYPTAYFLDAEGRVKGSVAGYTTTLGLLVRLLW